MSEKMLTISNHKCNAIVHLALGIPIVFLHGYTYTSNVWQNTGSLELLKEKHISFLALDMPYGVKSNCYPKTRDCEINVTVARTAILDIFGSTAPVIVGASLGAHMALEYATRFSVKGLLLIAPIKVSENRLVRAYSGFNFPVHIIRGSRDEIVSMDEMRNLTSILPNSKLKIYASEGHSAYLGRPDKFKMDLLQLYSIAQQS